MKTRLRKGLGWIVGIFVLVVVLGVFLSQAAVWASNENQRYMIKLSEKINHVRLTLEKQSDLEIQESDTDGEGEAFFSEVEEGEDYILTIGSLESYYVKSVTVTDVSNNDSKEELDVLRNEDGSCQCRIMQVNQYKKVEVNVSAKENLELTEIDKKIVFEKKDGSSPIFVPEFQEKGIYITSDSLKVTGTAADAIGYKTDKGDRVYNSNAWFLLEKSTTLEELYIKGDDNTWTEYTLLPPVKIVIDKIPPQISLKGEDIRWISEEKGSIDIQFTAEDISKEDGMPCAGLDKDKLEVFIVGDMTKVSFEECDKNTYQFSVSWDTIAGDQVTYQISAEDKLGNKDTCNVIVKKDMLEPEIIDIKMTAEEGGEIEYAEDATKSFKSIILTVTAEDAGSGVDTIGLKIKGEKILTKNVDKNNSATFKLELSDQIREIENIICADRAGNESLCKNMSSITPKIKSNAILIKQTSVDFSYEVQGKEGQFYSISEQKIKTIAVNSPAGKILQIDVEETKTPGMGFKSIVVKYGEFEQIGKASLQVVLDDMKLKEGDNEIEVTAKMQGGQVIEGSVIIRYDAESPVIKKIRVADSSDSAKDLDKRYVFAKFGTFYNGSTKIVVTADDNTGVRFIELLINGKAYGEPAAAVGGKAEFVVPKELIQQSVQKEYLNGSISASATDQVGNRSVEVKADQVDSNLGAGQFMIENVPPVITCSVPEAAYADIWYNGHIDFSVDIRDQNSGLYHVKAVLNGKTVKEVTSQSAYGKHKTETETFSINTSQGEKEKDGSYTLELTVVDNAGNKSTVTKKIFIDNKKPEIVSFEFDASGYNEGKKTEFGVSEKNYGYYFRKKTKVTVRAKDAEPSSGLRSITYYMVDKDKKKTEEKTEEVSSSGTISFLIPANFKGQVYAKPTDYVNNSADDYVTPDGAVIENQSQHNQDSEISFTKPRTENKDKKGQELYKKDIIMTIKVADRYSGIRKVEYSVEAPYDTKKNLKGELEFNNKGEKKEGSSSGWERTGKEKNLVTELTGKIKITNNSNDIVVKVKMTDRSGHVTTESDIFSIDKTAPVIRISYDNNKDDKDFRDFYQEKRTANIVITERNFDAEDVKYRAVNQDGDVPQIALTEIRAWTKNVDNKDPDRTTYTARISFNEDGKYTWSIAFKDMADNEAAKMRKQEYTIDQTAPVITVAYDNEKAANGYYYNKNRTATITIKEHNFEESRIKIDGRATNDGKDVEFPNVMGWSSSGDVHTAIILYSQDAEYFFKISYMDKAGNKEETPVEDHFIIDQTRPQLTISGVENESAYKEKVIPVVTYEDVNLDPATLNIRLEGAKRGKVDIKGETGEYRNGEKFEFDDFEKKREIDDIYILSAYVEDRAGNRSISREVEFSVNRFGSTYRFEMEPLSSITKETEKGVYQYVREEFDVVLTEVNVDELKKEKTKIRMSKDGVLTELEENNDYSVTPKKKKKWREYTYRIFHERFVQDGHYEVEVRSEDKATNINENTDKNKQANIKFAVDKTAPKILPGDLENNTQYPLENKKVKITVNDNLKLSGVKMYLNENEIVYNNEDDDYFITIPSANQKQNLRIVAYDAAENEQTETIEGFLISTNLFVRWYNNLPLFVGTLSASGILVVIGILIIILRRIKKKEREKEAVH